MDHFELRNGALHAEDVPLSTIAEAVGTPAYVYSQATIERHIAVFRDAVSGAGVAAGGGEPLIAYAVKANPNGAVLRLIAREGLGADVVSGGELIRAVAAGIAPEKIVFSGVGKTEEELTLALGHGIGQFNIESEPEAEMLSAIATRMGVEARVAYRVNPDVDAGTHAKISTGKSENKFGIPIDTAVAAYARLAELPGIRAQGVSVHIGSQLTSLAPLESAFAKVGELIRQLRAEGHTITVGDLGGGLGVPYDPALPVPPSPADYGAMVERVTKGWNVRLFFAPGRLIVANAGVLLSRVVRVKQGAVSRWVILDAAMNDLMRPSLYDAYHDVRAVTPRGGRELVNVVGPVCETGDTFATARDMDTVAADDLVVFLTAGAYGATMANTYNSRALAPEILVSGSDWAVVRPRPPIEALIEAEVVPGWLG